MFDFRLPDLGEGIHEGEIIKWHVQVGDLVKADDPLVDVETDKAAVTIPSPVGGRIVRLGGNVGDMVTVGAVIAVIDETATEARGAAPEAEAPKPMVAEAFPGKPAARPVPAAPATRHLARELDVDLSLVSPTGPGGRVTAEDVRRFAAGRPAPGSPPEPVRPAPPQPPAEAERPEIEAPARAATAIPYLDLAPLPDFAQWGPVDRQPLRSIRRKVAYKMVTSKILVPHVAHMDEADVTLLEEFRHRENERRRGQIGAHLTLLAFVIKAVTAGLRATPAFNASLDPFKDEIIYKKYYNVGIAVDTGKGLVVPVIRDTDRKSIVAISSAIEDLAQRAREGTVEVGDLQG
ncbi:MAG TPA: dihydrolipoamide acetyltransferase family protein, partial [Syntrophobacteria bacterium]|nr:dihydrolipoamide acetyltransferase family protein [Syntrophobacteria bacterium]